jgi:DNA-binding NtrC family response regulator
VILSTLEQFKGHRLRTAAALGIGVRTLGMKIKRWREEGEPIAGRQPRPTVHVDVS